MGGKVTSEDRCNKHTREPPTHFNLGANEVENTTSRTKGKELNNEEGDGVMNKNSLYQSMVLIKGEEETYK